MGFPVPLRSRRTMLERIRPLVFFFSSRRRHTRCSRDWSSDVCSSDLLGPSSRFVAPHDFIWEGNLPNPPPIDLDGHGTHVSGTIGQLTNNNAGEAGVAFNVKLMPVKGIDSKWDDIFGSANQGTDEVGGRRIRHAAGQGAQVLQISIGPNGAA